MPTPPKPHIVLLNEKKSHRTKAELEQRKQAEKSLESGRAFCERSEVRKNKVAHKEFKRIEKLLQNINKNDALYEGIINRYCLIIAECLDFEVKRESFYNDMFELESDKQSFVDNDDLSSYYGLKNSMQKQIIDLDKQVQAKRKMLLDIEKENIMTIASALRSIPKKAQEDEDPLLKLLKAGGNSG